MPTQAMNMRKRENSKYPDYEEEQDKQKTLEEFTEDENE